MRRIGSKGVDGLIVRFVRTAHTMFFRRGRTIACTLVLATVLGAVEVGSAHAGSVTIRTYQYNYRSGGGGFSWGGGGGGCPAGQGYCGSGCAPIGSTCCANGRYCAGNQVCTNNGNNCLDRSDERVCPDGSSSCGPGFLCTKDYSCLSMASDRYCGNRHYCDIGSVCQPGGGGGCRTQASIDAEANLRAEQERGEQERAQQRLEEQERAQQQRVEHEAPPGGQTNLAQPASSPLDSLANGICPTNSQSDVTGLGGSSAPTLLPPKPNCKLPGVSASLTITANRLFTIRAGTGTTCRSLQDSACGSRTVCWRCSRWTLRIPPMFNPRGEPLPTAACLLRPMNQAARRRRVG